MYAVIYISVYGEKNRDNPSIIVVNHINVSEDNLIFMVIMVMR